MSKAQAREQAANKILVGHNSCHAAKGEAAPKSRFANHVPKRSNLCAFIDYAISPT